jgi:hypothetical protein
MSGPRKQGELFFVIGIRLFFAAALVSLLVVALGGIVQMRVLGGLAFLCAFLGLSVCALGMRVVDPDGWRAKLARVQWVLGLRDHPPYRRTPALADSH